jgi:hypothetical protein
MNVAGDYVYTSQNLLFSSRWLTDFNQMMTQKSGRAKMFNCSESGIMHIPQGNLERRMKRAKRRHITEAERAMVLQSGTRELKIPASNMAQMQLEQALSAHKYIAEISLKYIDPGVLEWANTLN